MAEKGKNGHLFIKLRKVNAMAENIHLPMICRRMELQFLNFKERGKEDSDKGLPFGCKL